MLLFDTYVQKLKYKVLKEVACHAYAGTLQDCYLDISKAISPGPKSTMRCCIYKAVSYTHLDVYKRQPLRWAAAPGAATPSARTLA